MLGRTERRGVGSDPWAPDTGCRGSRSSDAAPQANLLDRSVGPGIRGLLEAA